MNLDVGTVLSILSLLGIGGVVGAYFNHLFERKWEIEKKLVARKEEQYRKFLENLLAFYEGWSDQDAKKNFMRELYTHAPLYASDKVIRCANEFLRSFEKPDPKVGGKSDVCCRKLILAIRREIKKLNRDKSNLEEEDFEVLKLAD